jgi:chorismate mutase
VNSGDLAERREEAKKLMSGIFRNFYDRRSVVRDIGERKSSLRMQMEDYLQEFRLMEEFRAFGGNEGRLFSILIQDSLESQGLAPRENIYGDLEIEGITALCAFNPGNRDDLENYVRSTVPGTEQLSIEFVQGRRLAILSWVIEFGYGKAVNIIEPMGRSLDQPFWAVGSRPYRHSSLRLDSNILKYGTVILKVPNAFGRGINVDDRGAIGELVKEDAHMLFDITYSEMCIGKQFSGIPTMNDKSVMVYGIPGTVGCPWETAAVIGERSTVERILKRSYSLSGIKPSIMLPAPPSNISVALEMLKSRVKELQDLVGESFTVPEQGPFGLLSGKKNAPPWIKSVDASFYGNYRGFRVVNLLI